MQLVAHEVAHTLQDRGFTAPTFQSRNSTHEPPRASLLQSQIIRREKDKELDFDKAAWDATATVYDELGNSWETDSFGEQFRSGAFEYLGVTLGRTGYELSHNPTSSDESHKARFLKAFTQPLKIRQTIPTATGIIDTEVKVDSTYAEAVFDAAVSVVENANVDVTESNKSKSAVETDRVDRDGAEPDIEVDPRVYARYRFEESVAPAYGGFWILMHELFHRAGPKVYKNLAKIRMASTGIEEKDTGIYGLDPQNYDAKNTSPGPIVSLVNVLRAGFGLPIRTNYGETHRVYGEEKIQIGDEYTEIDFDAEHNGPGVVRAPSGLSALEERKFITHLIERDRGAPQRRVWAKRLEQARLTISDSQSTQHFEPIGGRVQGREYNPELEEADSGRRIQLYANWDVAEWGDLEVGAMWESGFPIIRMGRVDLFDESDDVELTGTLVSPTVFYRSSTLQGPFVDEGYLSGDWESARLFSVEKGTWKLELAGSRDWYLQENGTLSESKPSEDPSDPSEDL